MFDVRKKLALAFFFAWVLLFALGATLAIPHVVSPRLEAAARDALSADPAFSSLTPRFEGFTGSFTGTLASAEQLEKAYALAIPALPAGSFREQSPGQFLSRPQSEPAIAPDAPDAGSSRIAPPEASDSASPTASKVLTGLPAAKANPHPSHIVATSSSSEPPGSLESPQGSAQPIGSSAADPNTPEASPASTVQIVPVPLAAGTPSPVISTPPPSAPAPEPLPASAAVGSRPESSTQVYVPEEWHESPSPAPAPAVRDLSPSLPAADAVQEVDEWTGTVFFATDSSVLQDSQLPILRRVAEDSRSKPDYQLRVISFADPRGNQEFNTWLSRRRAERVRSELAKLGVNVNVELAVDLESSTSPILEHPEIQRRVELRYVR